MLYLYYALPKRYPRAKQNTQRNLIVGGLLGGFSRNDVVKGLVNNWEGVNKVLFLINGLCV